MTNDLISVIIPVYNVEKYLDRCMNCVLNQTYKNIEIILVDDGSTDSGGEICNRYQKEDNRIVVIHKANGGLSDARNKGIDAARGDYIVFIDSDDMVSQYFIEKLYSALTKTNADIAMCYNMTFSDIGEIKDFPQNQEIRVIDKEEFFNRLYFPKHNQCISAWNKIYKRSFFEKVRFPYGKLHEDSYTTYLFIDQAERIAILPEALYYYFRNPEGIMRSKIKLSRLDDIEAHLNTLRYMYEHNYESAKRDCAKFIIERCIYYISLPKKEYVSYDEFMRVMKKTYREARKQLLKYGGMRADWYLIVFLSGIDIRILKRHRDFLNKAYKRIKRKN